MSSNPKAGRSSHKILTIVAAVFAVAFMLAAPLLVAVDSDADLTEAKMGFRADMTNPTDDQLAEWGYFEKSDFLMMPIDEYLTIFNQDLFNDPVVGSEPLKLIDAWGEKIESDSVTDLITDEVLTDEITITITVKANGKLINTFIDDYPADVRAAAAAVQDYLGEDVVVGDKVVITGKINWKLSEQTTDKYKLLEGGKCVIDQSVYTYYLVDDMDLDVKLVKSGSEKSFKIVSDLKGVFVSEWQYKYDSETITEGTGYTATNTVSSTYSGGSHFTVDGKDYNLDVDEKVRPQRTGTAVLIEQSSIVISDTLKYKVNKLPATTGNIAVDKTYDAAETVFGEVVLDALGDDILKIIIIAIVVFVIVVALIVILIVVLIHRKKKRQ